MLLNTFLWLLLCNLIAAAGSRSTFGRQPCSSLSKLQYRCKRPLYSPDTQQPVTCQPDNSIIALCEASNGIQCSGLLNDTNFFEIKIPDACDYNAHASFSTALLLSIFLGFLGIDRIYLGYYAIGLFKMFSLGGLFVVWLADVVLISLQILLPADGSSYVMPLYGPHSTALRFQPTFTNYSLYTCVDCA